jgi:probable HAF family extracellular repeat protein
MRSSPANCIGLATTLLLLLASAAHGDLRRYSLLDVGPYYSNPIVGSDAPIGLAGSGVALNSRGQVVATELSTATNVTNPYRAFRTAPNQPINFATDDLGTLTPPGTGRSYPTAINDLGQVVGVSGSTAFRTAPQAAIGPLDGLGGLGGGTSSAAAINNLGQVAGAGRTPSGKDHAFRTAPGAAVNPLTDDLGDLFDGNQFSASTGINNKGQVVGLSGINPTRAFRTSPNAKINPLTDDLGSLGGPQTQAIAINDAGQVVGDSDISPSLHHAFRTAPNAAINSSSDLGMPAGHDPAVYRSVAWALNQAGDVVGWYVPVNQAAGRSRAFLYTDDGIVDLNDLLDPSITGWTLMAGYGINDSGQILAVGNFNGADRLALLTPTPEPGSLVTIIICGGALLWRRRGRRFESPAR